MPLFHACERKDCSAPLVWPMRPACLLTVDYCGHVSAVFADMWPIPGVYSLGFLPAWLWPLCSLLDWSFLGSPLTFPLCPMAWPVSRHSPNDFLWGTWYILFCWLVMLLPTSLCLVLGISYGSTWILVTTRSSWFFQLHMSCSCPIIYF